jgi:hypothetical protein
MGSLLCCFAEIAAWFDNATADVPAEGYFFGFNSPGPNATEFFAPSFEGSPHLVDCQV